jgi:hypothetical protein
MSVREVQEEAELPFRVKNSSARRQASADVSALTPSSKNPCGVLG